jgi:cation:H+ antiporter
MSLPEPAGAALALVAGFALLVIGGHYLVRGAVGIALRARVSVTVVALTVVAMGTSAPELAVSLDAVRLDVPAIAYGNIIGSCIFNIGAILGITALVAPIPVQRQTIWFEYPFMLLAAVLTVALAWNGTIDRGEGGALVLGLIGFTLMMIWFAARGVPVAEMEVLEADVDRKRSSVGAPGWAWVRFGFLVLFGTGALVGGAELSVRGAVEIARTLGVTERIIGLTVIAMGTSLPELVTCLVATARREPEIALGNVVGSNIFNLLAILGVTAAMFGVEVDRRAIALDNWVMLGFSLVIIPMMLRGRRISRANAVLLLAGFVAYMGYLLIAEV